MHPPHKLLRLVYNGAMPLPASLVASIVSAIIALAKILQLQVVAEGVERVEELAFLRQQGCGYIQGYLASRPLDQDAIEDWYGQTAKARTERARVVPLSRCA